MLELGIKTLIAYLLGTLLGSLVLGRLRGVDIRRMGSGNAGATNALRTQGKLFGLLVLLIDVGKGVAAVLWVPALTLPGVALDPEVARPWLTVACAVAVILGHVYPVWFGFRGGKGVATVVGVVGAVQASLLVPLILGWFLVVLLTGFVGLASMLAALGLAVTVFWLEPDNVPLLVFCAWVAVFVLYTHRANTARMLAGDRESRAAIMVVSLAGGLERPSGVEPPSGPQPPSGVEPPPLLVLLADGRLRSGEWLAAELGVSRAAVWKGIERLRRHAIGIEAVPRRGYRLVIPVELLDGAAIRAALDPARAARLRSLQLIFEVDSTNSRLLEAAPPPFGRADVVLSELQHAGRGRRGRHWFAPFGGGITLSMGWSFIDTARVSPALSLCVGVAVARALERAGASGIELKWPNDIWFEDRKVGGVLLELRAESGGPAHVVIGVGLNVSLDTAARIRIESLGAQAAAVADACAAPPSRNFIAGAIIDELLSMLAEFERAGFAAFREAWTARDALRGRRAQVLIGEEAVSGTARGVDDHGALRLDGAGGLREFVSGDVSLRLGGDDP